MEQNPRPTFADSEVNRASLARKARKITIAEFFGTPETVWGAALGAAAVAIVLPAAWPLALGVLAFLPIWLSGRRFRLPFRAPESWGDTDWGDPKPGTTGLKRDNHRKAEGLLYLGTDEKGRELWITNSDARRHIFALGTTGSGKTELLLGLMAQSIAWGSGCLVVDGKGTAEFAARVWSLAKRHGREDDVRIINLTGVSGSGEGEDPDAPAGSVTAESNTLNPFATGTADQLTNMVTSLMAPASGDGAMWRDRSVQLVSTMIRAVVELRDRGELMIDVQTLRDYLPLGRPIRNSAAETVDQLSDLVMSRLRRETSMTALYVRALRGEFSDATRLALTGFFDSLPGFDLAKFLAGKEQEPQTSQQYGYLTMQLTKPLGTMADDFAHIFRTQMAEVDMADVVYQRRILVVLLPALQKAASETRALGKVIIEMTKAMMGAAAGSRIVGSRQDIVESAPTRSATPFLCIFDELGYYLGEGLDVMAAQARSLGFSIVIGAQDLQAMRGGDPKLSQVADSVIANTFLNAYGATVDAALTAEFIAKKTGEMTVGAVNAFDRAEGIAGTSPRDTGTQVQYSSVRRVTEAELRALTEGEFWFVFQDRAVKGRSFYVGDRIVDQIAVNKFLRVRGPKDRVVHPTRAQQRDAEDDSHHRSALRNADIRLAGRTGILTRAALDAEIDAIDPIHDADGVIEDHEVTRADAVEQLAWLLDAAPECPDSSLLRELAAVTVMRQDLDPEGETARQRQAEDLDEAGGLTADEQAMVHAERSRRPPLERLMGRSPRQDETGTTPATAAARKPSALDGAPPRPAGIGDRPRDGRPARMMPGRNPKRAGEAVSTRDIAAEVEEALSDDGLAYLSRVVTQPPPEDGFSEREKGTEAGEETVTDDDGEEDWVNDAIEDHDEDDEDWVGDVGTLDEDVELDEGDGEDDGEEGGRTGSGGGPARKPPDEDAEADWIREAETSGLLPDSRS